MKRMKMDARSWMPTRAMREAWTKVFARRARARGAARRMRTRFRLESGREEPLIPGEVGRAG